MNQDWQNFLSAQHAHIQNGVVSHFGAAGAERLATRGGTVLCDLSQFGTLRVSGVEAESFLQNLLSNDIRDVSSARAQFSSLNSPKGRMLATMLIWRDGDDYLLQLPHVLCEPIRKKLGMYVLRAKVKITDASDEIVSIGLSGADTQQILHARFGELPQLPLGFFSTSSASVIKISDTRFQINTAAQHAPALWATLNQHAQPVGSVCWDWLNIRSGIPVILPQTQEQFVPQMVNLDLAGGVNFKKGCYPGQEIVARMQYLGKLKRRMFLAHIDTLPHPDSNETPQPGDELFSADMEGQASGMLVNTAPSPSGGHDVLAVAQTSSREAQTVRWKSLQGAALQFLPLPYTLPL
ncbi:MAG: folate-binding protein [Betaproteobacteria bacterium RBG_16_56_24]|nr:MAG: folate-binding protein [Betaproteobacteria bacterium RBG_16_56_24]